MNKKQKRLVRIIAIVMALLLAGGAIFSAIFSLAYAEEATADRNECALTMEYMANEQALRISQRLVYTNASSVHLDRVMFYMPANMFRRQSALMYDGDALTQAFPMGYVPGGVELNRISIDGTAANWGFQGENELYLRVACDLDSGESCEFTFDYHLLVTENCAFLGADKTDWRLSGFYFAPASVDESRGEFILNTPIAFTHYIDTPAADFTASILLPDTCLLTGTGVEQAEKAGEHTLRWTVRAENVRDFALSFGNSFKETLRETASGVRLRCLTSVRSSAERVLDLAEEALTACEAWFGPLPLDQLDFAQSGIGADFLTHSGCVWLSKDLLDRSNADELAHALRFSIAKQYFGLSAYARPSSDAWLSDSVCEYISYLLIEKAEGHNTYLRALNERLVPSLQLTIPGGLVVTSDAALFDAYEYEIVVLNRGAAVFHELRTAMGLENILAGFRLFHQLGLEKDVLTEMDLVAAMDEASGASWEKFLTDWVFNIGDYVNQTIDWLD